MKLLLFHQAIATATAALPHSTKPSLSNKIIVYYIERHRKTADLIRCDDGSEKKNC